MTSPLSTQQADEKEQEIHLHVNSPIDPHSREIAFPAADTIGAAATEAAKDFGHEGDDYTFQERDGQVLDRSITLTEAGLHNGDHVEIVNAGGGV